jgi:predicted HAD superfamily phosphohydrolase YqeG
VETWTDGGSWDPTTDAGVTTIRKPEALLVRFALQLAGNLTLDDALMVGDQYFTDIAGANEAGVRALKVRTWQRRSFPWPVAWMQRMEAVMYRVFFGKVTESPTDGKLPR